jgi:hypothetical protein
LYGEEAEGIYDRMLQGREAGSEFRGRGLGASERLNTPFNTFGGFRGGLRGGLGGFLFPF